MDTYDISVHFSANIPHFNARLKTHPAPSNWCWTEWRCAPRAQHQRLHVPSQCAGPESLPGWELDDVTHSSHGSNNGSIAVAGNSNQWRHAHIFCILSFAKKILCWTIKYKCIYRYITCILNKCDIHIYKYTLHIKYTYVNIYIYVCMYVYVSICLYVKMNTCIYVYMYISIYVYMQIFLYV